MPPVHKNKPDQLASPRRPTASTSAAGHSHSPFAKLVSFRVRRLEPILAWAIAGCTLWVNIALNTASATAWWLVILGAAIGGWGRMVPARHQGMLFARATLLMAGAFLLHVTPESGGATGSYFYWPFLVAGFYAFLLATGWSTLLALVALMEFGLACWLAPPASSWQQTIALVGVMGTMVVLAITFARSFQASDEQAESSLRDERTNLYNESGVFVHGAVLLEECRKNARPFSIVLLNGKDLRDIPELLGRKVANDLFFQAVQAIAAIQGDGIAARVDSTEFALLLPGVTHERAKMLVERRLGTPPRLEVTIKSQPIVIVMDMAVAQAKEKDQTVEDLYDELHAHWARENGAQRAVPKKTPFMEDDERFDSHTLQASSTVPMHLQPRPQCKKS